MYIEFVWEPKPKSGIYGIWRKSLLFEFKPNKYFGNRWVLKVDDEEICNHFLKASAFERVMDGAALKSDSEFVKTVLENWDVIYEIARVGGVIDESPKQKPVVTPDNAEDAELSDFSKKSIGELRTIAKKSNLKQSSKMKKTDLIQLITAGK